MKSPYPPTEVYSLGYWLKDYGFYPKRWPAYVYMDHGNVLQDCIYDHEIKTAAPLIFKFAPRLVKMYKETSKKPVYCLVNPTIHCRNKRKYKQRADAKGTLFYVAHSTELVEDLTNWDDFMEHLKKIPSEFHPIELCLHPTDIKKGLDKVFIEKGYKIVTAGDAWANTYADNLYKILSGYKYTMSNLCGSYLYYSVEMGIPFSIYGEEPKYYNKGDANIEMGQYDSYKNYDTYQYAVKVFTGFQKEITAEQREFVDVNLGKRDTISRFKASLLLYKALLLHLSKHPGVSLKIVKELFRSKKLEQQL